MNRKQVYYECPKCGGNMFEEVPNKMHKGWRFVKVAGVGKPQKEETFTERLLKVCVTCQSPMVRRVLK